jgi:hypothetical protein
LIFNKFSITSQATVNGEMATVDGEMATINGEMATVNGDKATINGEMATVNGEMATVDGERATKNADMNTKVEFVCGNCKKIIPKQLWDKHYDFHYSVAWRIGLDPIIYLNNQSLVCELMERFKKLHSLKFFTCEKCLQITKTAPIDILMHMEQCGRSFEEIESLKKKCSCCEKKFLPTSLLKHKAEIASIQLTKLQQPLISTRPLEPVSYFKENPNKSFRSPKADQVSLYQMEMYLKSFEETSNEQDANTEPSKIYTCGNCRQSVTTGNWLDHFNSHNGIAWRLDIDLPIDLTKIKWLIKIVATFKTLNQRKDLVCKKCFVRRKRPIDYVKHVEMCEGVPSASTLLTHESECDHCKVKVKDANMYMHVRDCSKLNRFFKDVGGNEPELLIGNDLLEQVDDSNAVGSFSIEIEENDEDSDNSDSSSG